MPDNEDFWNEVEAVPVSDAEFKAALEASVKEHQDRRANALESVQVRKVRFLLWEWRFY